MEIEYQCRYDKMDKLIGRWPWVALSKMALYDDVIRLYGCMSVRAVRKSAYKWGQKWGGRISVRRDGDTLVCTLKKEAELDVVAPGRPSRYPILQALQPGEVGWIRWLPLDRDQGAIWRAIDREQAKGKKIYGYPTPRGIRIERRA